MPPDTRVEPDRLDPAEVVVGPRPGVPPHVRMFCVLTLALFLWMKGTGHPAMAWTMLAVGAVALLAHAFVFARWLFRRRRLLGAGEADLVERHDLARRAERELPRPEVDPDRWVLAGMWFVAGGALLSRGDVAVAVLFAGMPATYVLIETAVLVAWLRRRRSLLREWSRT